MAPVDYAAVEEKMTKLRTVISKLEQLRQSSVQQFIEEFKISDAAMHNLVLGIEVIMDIGNHILSEVFQIKADNYADIIQKLGEGKVIPKSFAKENSDMAKFRNLIIHEYGEIDIAKVYEYTEDAPDVFRQFAQYFNDFLESRE